ncbi:MAG: aminoglycoside phosphotransferase family protein [Pseudomonadota bacterium]
MSNDQPIIDLDLARHLVLTQFPKWRDLPIQPVAMSGWDNRTFHLGDRMLVRLPSAESYVPAVLKEQTWLPRLAPFLPLKIPEPLIMGNPDDLYPWPWSIYGWIEGDTAACADIADRCDLARDLADFLKSLYRIDTTDGPLPKLSNFEHLKALKSYDDEARQAIGILKNKIDANVATQVWEKAIETTWASKPLWVHGDISAGNLLVNHGKLCAVIDFGGLSIGDPACDLAIAWKFFKGESREAFKNSILFDEGTWSRARAWAFWKALIIEAGLTESNAVETSYAWQTITEVMEDYKHNG